MKKDQLEVLMGQLLDEHLRLQLQELAELCNTTPSVIVEMVEYGLFEPEGRRQEEWKFSGTTVKKLNTALRLQHDLEINLPGVVVIVDMLDELMQLRAQLASLKPHDE